MPALVAGIHVLKAESQEDVDGRNKSGHDDGGAVIEAKLTTNTFSVVPLCAWHSAMR